MDNIILIGFMGAGKTSVGKEYALKYQKSFLDTDQLLEQKAGMKIPQIFEQHGEAHFRMLETEVLRDLLLSCRASVLSVGGGLPVKEENRRLLKQLGTVIYLQTDADTVLERLKGFKNRPLLKGNDRREKILQLMEARSGIYSEAADYEIQTVGRTVVQVAEEINKVVVK